MTQVLYGAPVKEYIKIKLIKKLKKLSKAPSLLIVQVGDRADSNIYIKNKVNFGKEIGVFVSVKKLKEDISEEDLKKEIKNFVADSDFDGIIVQLPLPKDIKSEEILNLIPKKKDADGLSGIFDPNFSNIITPATARAVFELLKFYKIEIENKKVAVLGRSKLAGGPIAEALKQKGAEVCVFGRDADYSQMTNMCRKSDILISATGQINLVNKDFVNKDQTVLDIGINKIEEKIVGDVNFEEVSSFVSKITPTPGGIGPITVACLFQNLLDLLD